MTKIQPKFLDGTKVSKLNVNGNENGIFSDYIYAKIWRTGNKNVFHNPRNFNPRNFHLWSENPRIPGFNLYITYFQINTMDRDFNKEILHLVDMLREVSKRQKSDSVLNLVLKLDFNHYLTKMAAAEA